jgi:hypothetical protein
MMNRGEPMTGIESWLASEAESRGHLKHEAARSSRHQDKITARHAPRQRRPSPHRADAAQCQCLMARDA